MPFVTKYGTYFGQIPQQLGRVHFVAPAASYTVDGRAYIASDDNDGLSPERALLTLSQALTNVTASAGEVIYLLEGTHVQTATIRVQKAGIAILGVQSAGALVGVNVPARHVMPKSKLSWLTAAAPGLSIEADNVEVGHVTLRPASGFGTVIFRNASPDALYMHDFVVDMAAGQAISLDTAGIDFGYRADVAGLASRSMTRLAQTTQRATAYLENFAIISGGANGNGILTATADLTVVNGRLHTRAGAWATPFAVATGTGYIFIQGSHWTCQTLTGMGTQLDGTNAGIINGKVSVRDCRFAAQPLNTGSAIDNFTAGVAEVIESYQAQVAGAAGTAQSSSA
jgi:hypothetical protein